MLQSLIILTYNRTNCFIIGQDETRNITAEHKMAIKRRQAFHVICESKKLVNLYVSVCFLVEIISVGLTVNAGLRTAAMPWNHGRHIWNTMHENHLPNLGGAKR